VNLTKTGSSVTHGGCSVQADLPARGGFVLDYRGTSLIRNRLPLGTLLPGTKWWSWRFLMSVVPLYVTRVCVGRTRQKETHRLEGRHRARR